MKAFLVSEFNPDPSTIKPSEVPTPTPKSNEYLIRVTHCAPQHADILHAQGRHQNNNAKKGWLFPPFILGYDFAGIIKTVPTDSNGKEAFKKGDRIFGIAIGAFTEYICVKAASIRKVPDGLSLEAACAMSGSAVSYAAVTDIAKVQPGEIVMVSGASGGLGSVCCMVAKALGAKVIALVGDAEKAEAMRRDMGVDLVVLIDGEGKWIEEVQEWTKEHGGVDVFLDNTGMVNEAIKCLAYFGRIVILGFAARGGVMEEVKMNKLLLKSITITGYRFGESGRRFPKMLEEIWDGYLGMLKDGRLKPLIYGRYEGLEDIGRALKDLEKRKVYGKIVVKVSEEEESAKL